MKIKNSETNRVRKVLVKTFMDIKKEARKNKICKRKACGCAILCFKIADKQMVFYTTYIAVNGPSGLKNKCSGIKGACGCSHAEPRAIMKFLQGRIYQSVRYSKVVLLTTFSSCVNCANIIVDSGVIDAVGYEFLAPHWAVEPNDAKSMLDRSLIHFAKNEMSNELIRSIFEQENVDEK